jgi:hypothetical protein
MIIESRRARVYAEYNQFYVEDPNHPGNTGDPAFWTKQACDDRIAILPSTMAIGTGSYEFVEVTTEINDREPLLGAC